MSVSGPSPLNSEGGYDEYMFHAALVRRRVRVWITRLPETRSVDNGFLASVMAFRVLAEGAPEVCAIMVAKGEVDHWQQCYLEWFERMKRRFPKKLDTEGVKERALAEFARLRALGVDLPTSNWQTKARLDLKTAAREEEFRAQMAREAAKPEAIDAPAKEAKAADPWHPCRLVTYPGSMGEPRFGLIFSQLSLASKAFKSARLKNDGYSWQKLVELYLAEQAPQMLASLQFDCEASMFCARSSDESALEAVRSAVAQVLEDEPTRLRLVEKLKARRG